MGPCSIESTTLSVMLHLAGILPGMTDADPVIELADAMSCSHTVATLRCCRAATAALNQLEALDERAATAEAALEAATADLHTSERASAERDAVEAQCSVLRERLEETRAQADQLANYKQVCGLLN